MSATNAKPAASTAPSPSSASQAGDTHEVRDGPNRNVDGVSGGM